MNEQSNGQGLGRERFVVELFGNNANGRKMIAWGAEDSWSLRGAASRAAGRPGLAAPRLAEGVRKPYFQPRRAAFCRRAIQPAPRGHLP